MKFVKIWKWKTHWQIVLAIVVGILVGLLIRTVEMGRTLGVEVTATPEGTVVVSSVNAQLLGGEVIQPGDRLVALRRRGGAEVTRVSRLSDYTESFRRIGMAESVVLVMRRGEAELEVSARMHSHLLAPFDFAANLFLRLLKMLIVPLILTSMISGVTSVGRLGDLGRMGVKTLLYYVLTSMLAILLGLVLVNLIQPGWGADLPLREKVGAAELQRDQSFVGIFLRMVPENVFEAFGENGRILQVIFFSLLVGIFITRVGGEHGRLLTRVFQAGFEVMMRVAEFVLLFIPLGVLVLIARVVGASGLEAFKPLLLLMLTVVLALLIHSAVTLPLILSAVGKVNPWRWAKAMAPALLTAFSTSSSSVTLPVTMRSAERRGGVSNRSASFVLPLGATINMDGTALYECVGVIFLAQYYASSGEFDLTLANQVVVVITALLASIGAAGIPSAGLVMMTTILGALGLPLEGVTLLLAIDRPLDMLRTTVNVWSDSTCAAVIAASEGETGIAAGEAEKGGGDTKPAAPPEEDEKASPAET